MLDSGSDAPGIHLHHGNRLERLADALAECLRCSPADPFVPDVVLVPHPGMAQWLKMRLADALGIAAHLDFPLPAVWFDRLAGTGLTQADTLAWSREALAWRIYGLRDLSLGPLSALTGTGERDELARWQLSGQIAELFERYQLQRPDWLRSWTTGHRLAIGTDSEAWQARLWQQLVDAASDAQRQALMRRLDPEPPSGAALPARVFAFGFASLPRRFLDGLSALAKQQPVHLFFPNPCRWYWGDLLTEREQFGRARRLNYKPDIDPDAEGHPLLAGFGAVGRDFMHQLYAGDAAFASENEYFRDAPNMSLLAQLQNGILDLEPVELTWSESDKSVRLLAAPNRRRELEALHDLLLALLDDRSLDLRPHEIAVMMPKLSDYAPLVDAVFGGQPRGRRIPWQLTDLSEIERHPLPALFLKLIDLPVWRFGLSDVLDALTRPAFAAAFGIASDERARLVVLLEKAGARWGLDGAFRAQRGAGNDGIHTFRFALDRLLNGWLLGDDVEFTDGIAPYAALRGDDVDLIGRFAVCLDTLDRWRGRLINERSLADWAGTLVELRNDCLVDSTDDSDNAALLRLIAALDRWCERSAVAGSVVVPRRVIRDAIAESLHSNAVSALPGEGVNICAMVPLHGLPFRVIALLGMGEGEFPRRDREHPDDLCRIRPRPGDRSIVAEDRYVLLEAIASARDVLILSHVDRDSDIGLARAPSPVLGEFHDYLRDYGLAGDAAALNARVERVAILPTDVRHFASDSTSHHVQSYAHEWLALPLLDGSTMVLPQELPVHWSDLRALFIDPARTQLRWRGVDFAERDEPVEDNEPFTLDRLSAYRVRSAILDAFIRDASVPRDGLAERIRAAALLPPGRMGDRVFTDIWQEARRTFANYEEATGGRDLEEVHGKISIDGINFDVRIAHTDAAGLVRWSAGKLKGKRRMAAWLDLLALSLLRDGTNDVSATLIGLDGIATLTAPCDPESALRRLLSLWQRARAEPLPWYPETSAAYAEAMAVRSHHDPERAQKKARETWYGDEYGRRTGESSDPACAELARCFTGFNVDPFASLALEVYGPVFAEQAQ